METEEQLGAALDALDAQRLRRIRGLHDSLELELLTCMERKFFVAARARLTVGGCVPRFHTA